MTANATGKIRFAITFLELTEPPSRPAAAAPSGNLALLRAETPPLHFYRYLFNTVGEPWLWIDRRRLSDDDLAAVIHDEAVEILVLYAAGVPAGFIELAPRSADTMSIQYFGLIPEFVGRGLGAYLLDAGIRAAWRPGTRKLVVNTCTLDHPRALACYQRSGFRPVRQEIHEKDDPRLTGLIPSHVAIDRHPIIGTVGQLEP